jgi:hypothetical protein
MIMKKMATVLSFIVVGCAFPDFSWAHRHVVAQDEQQRRSLMFVEPHEFVGPVLNLESLSQRAERPSWDWVGLTHTDPHHLIGTGPHYAVPYRNFQMPDGGALMFSWPLGSLPTFQMSTQAPPREASLNRENAWGDPRPW